MHFRVRETYPRCKIKSCKSKGIKVYLKQTKLELSVLSSMLPFTNNGVQTDIIFSALFTYLL